MNSVVNLDMRNKTTSKKNNNDVMLATYEVIVNLVIFVKFESEYLGCSILDKLTLKESKSY